MIAIIRIHGRVKLKEEIKETLSRLRLRRKLVCVLVEENDRTKLSMVEKVRGYVTYGKIDDDLIKQIIEKRGETIDGKKIDKKNVNKIFEGIEKGEWKIKRFFRLHPPVGGFKKSTKQFSPKGILGKNKDISKLIARML